MKLTPVLKIAENLMNQGFTYSKCKEGTIYNATTNEKREVPHDVLEAMMFLDGFVERVFERVFERISNN